MNILQKLRHFNHLLNSNKGHLRQQEDIYCLQLLQKILNDGCHVQLTSMSLRPYVIAFLVNEMFINNRKKIIEFGSGISTILLARAARSKNNGTRIVSVEENKEWCTFISQILHQEGLADFVTMLHIPLEKKELLGNSSHWYNQESLTTSLKGQETFDMVVIDGPTAFSKQIAHSRYFAIPFLNGLLHESHAIFLDDANRFGERAVMKMWKEEFGKGFDIYAETLGVFYQGHHFESNPMKFIPIEHV